MDDPLIIDAEFEEIVPAPEPLPTYRWTFWKDDFPKLFGIVASAFVTGLLGWWFRAHPHWFGAVWPF